MQSDPLGHIDLPFGVRWVTRRGEKLLNVLSLLMFEVSCPSCRAKYPVDERRVPPTGLKMRCPKCGESFQVTAPAPEGAPVLGAALGLTAPSAAERPAPGRLAPGAPLGVRVGASLGSASSGGAGRPPPPRTTRSTMLGVAPAQSTPETSSTTAPRRPPPRPTVSEGAALPAVAPPRPARPAPATPAPATPDPAKPAPAKQPSRSTTLGVGTLAPRPAPPRVEGAAPSGIDLAPEELVSVPPPDEMEVDLPSASSSLPPSFEEAELPARASSDPSSGEFGDLPLPAPRQDLGGFGEEFDFSGAGAEMDLAPDLPAMPGVVAPQEIDLPSVPPGLGAAARDAEVDLPASVGEVDLPSVPPGAGVAAGEVDLPSVPPAAGPGAGIAAGHLAGTAGEIPDLPTVPQGRGPARPAPAPSDAALAVDLPVMTGDLPDLSADLPDLGGDLPDLGGELPTVGGGLPDLAAALPETGGALPDLAAELPLVDGKLPQRAAGLPAKLGQPLSDAPPDDSFDVASSAEFDDGGYGDVDLGSSPGGSGGAPPFSGEGDEFDAFPTEDSPSGHDSKSAEGGGDGYGEVALDHLGGGALALDEEPDRGEPPRGAPVAAHAAVERPVEAPGTTRVLPAEKKRLSLGAKIGIGAAVALTVAGGALTFVPEVGPYGAYVVMDMLDADKHAALLEGVRQEAARAWAADTAAGADRAFTQAEAAHETAPRYAALRAYAAYLGFLRQVRFGREGASFARAQVLLDALEGKSDADVPHLRLARLARDVANGKVSGAAKALAGARDLDGAVLAGEAALLQGEGERALQAWTAAASAQESPRTAFGLARAHMRLGRAEEAAKAAEHVIEKNPSHVGARLLLARLRLDDRTRDAALAADLEAVVTGEGASRGEQVEALNLLGALHLARSRVSKAEESFTKALQLQADSVEALRGLGDTMFAAGRFSEALARYEAAAKVASDDLHAQLGVVRAQLSLERLEDAVTLLERLGSAHEKSTAVAYWFGRAKELVGDRTTARESYKRAIELDEDGRELVESYVGLTRLLAQDGLAEEAAKEIAKALERFPERPEVYVAVGDLATTQGKYEEAIGHYDKALALDGGDIGTHFRRGVALRRARSFEEAQREFEGVAEIDPDYPGLALEWGLLFEASGRSEEALASYESALGKAPDDPDLMLRVGCGKAKAGQTDTAVELLKKVLSQRPNSAETNHCLGRALLFGDNDVREAMRYLDRAVMLDGNRAEHHLYVGWAANEARDPAKAERALTRALELDQTLAEAYWQRGVLRNRQGAVKDALLDLHRALEMNPSRYETHASLAEAYFNLGREQEALNHWRLAVTSGPGEPVWHYRYGKMLFDNRQVAAAREQLDLAVSTGEKATRKPVWLWEAHRLLALTIGRHPDAIPHWQAYLVNSDSNSPYRAEAMRALKSLQP